MKEKFSSIIATSWLCFIFLTAYSQVPPLLWLKGMGTNKLDISVGSGIDSSGFVYTAGNGCVGADFDPGPGTYTLGPGAFFISKLDSSGNFVWAIRFGIATYQGSSRLQAMVVDPVGNIYVTGYIDGNLDFDPGPATYTLPPAANSVFTAKYDSSGNFVWARSFGGNAMVFDLAFDLNGNVFTSGSFSGISDFDPGPGIFTLSNVGTNFSAFICKLDVNGNFVWAGNIVGTSWSNGYGITVSKLGEVYLTGSFFGTADFDPGPSSNTLSSTGSTDIFILKLDNLGNFIWAKALYGGSTSDAGKKITIDPSGNLISIGQFSGTVDFDPGSAVYNLTSIGISTNDMYLLKLDPSGNFVFAKNFATSFPYCIVSDLMNNIYISGYYSGTVDFDPGPGISNFTSAGYADAFIVKLDGTSNMLWTKSYGSTGNDDCKTISLDKANNIYCNGIYNGTVVFQPGPGNFSLTTVGQADIYELKLGVCYQPVAPLNITSSANKNICENTGAVISASCPGFINWYAGTTSTTVLQSGSSFTTTPLSVGVYTYYAEAFTCTNSAARTAISVSVVACAGLKEVVGAPRFIIYPNPSNGCYTLEILESMEQMDMAIYSPFGERIIERKIREGPNKIDLTEFPTGLYIVIVKNKDNVDSFVKLLKH